MAMVLCAFSSARRPSCTAMASGWMAPASSQVTLSGMGTVMEARQVKYWHSVPSVGSRPQ